MSFNLRWISCIFRYCIIYNIKLMLSLFLVSNKMKVILFYCWSSSYFFFKYTALHYVSYIISSCISINYFRLWFIYYSVRIIFDSSRNISKYSFKTFKNKPQNSNLLLCKIRRKINKITSLCYLASCLINMLFK